MSSREQIQHETCGLGETLLFKNSLLTAMGATVYDKA